MWWFSHKPKRIESAGPEVVLRQGWNEVQKKFWIQITDRKSGITIRKWMDEEYYQNFHNMGRFTYRQTKYEEGEFKDENEEGIHITKEDIGKWFGEDEWKNIP